MNRKQSGMTLLSFLMVLVVVGSIVYIGMKLFPMYYEHYAVRTALKSLANEPGTADMDAGKLEDLLFRRLDISYSGNVKPGNVKIERMANGWRMNVNYEVRRPIVGNLDVVGRFDASEEMTRHGGGD